jgi:NAD(P)-dependent dehydrogenase (short-subunit alcohol dehydrogenase family)
MKGDLNTVIVTGGSRGIGKAIVRNLVLSGFNVHIIARNRKTILDTIREIDCPGKLDFSTLDLMEKKEIKSFCENFQGSIYGLVNNAGMWCEELLGDQDIEDWGKIINLNLSGTYYLTKGIFHKIISGGRIVNISSQLGTGGREGFGAYSASKHGVIGLTKCWALEAINREITVNAVCPGWVRTESNLIELKEKAHRESTSFDEIYQNLCRTLPLRRFIEPEEVASLVGFLVSNQASGISGQIYEIK